MPFPFAPLYAATAIRPETLTVTAAYLTGEPTVPTLKGEVALDLRRDAMVKGDIISGVVGIDEIDVRHSARGPWFLLKVANQTGRIEMKAWSELAAAMDGFTPGAVVWIEALVGDGYPDKNDVGLTIQAIRRSTVATDVWDLIMPTYQGDVAALDARYATLTRGLRRPLKALLRAVWKDVGFARFREAPGARADGHHAYRHGLMEHSLEVAELVRAHCRLPRYVGRVDEQFAVVAALLHDLGKIEEYAWTNGPIRRAGRGRMSYHTVMGARMLERVFAKREKALNRQGVTRALVDHFAHVCESHHVLAEHGSPSEPLSVEARMVADADNASAQVAGVDDAVRRDRSADAEGFSVRKVAFHRNGVYHTPDWRPAPAMSDDEALRLAEADLLF